MRSVGRATSNAPAVLKRRGGAGLAILIVALASAASIAPAFAGTSSFGPLYSTTNGPNTQSVTFSVGATISGSATLDLTLYGNLGLSSDTVTVTVDGVVVGIVNGLQCTVFTRTVSIPAATLAPLIADGQITLSFTSAGGVNTNCFGIAPPFNLEGELAFAVQGTLSFAAGGTVNAAAVRQATLSTIRRFMNNRASAIVASTPDTFRMHRRLSGSIFGPGDAQSASLAPMTLGGPAATGAGGDVRRPGGPRSSGDDDFGGLRQRLAGASSPITVSGNTEDVSGAVSFSSSLSRARQVAEAQRAAQAAAPEAPMGLGSAPRPPVASNSLPLAFDVWTEGTTTYYRDDALDGRRKGNTSIVYVGADYVVRSSVLVGMLAQFDWANETSSVLGTSASGRGWLVGPYLSARLTPQLFFDARAAWGRSDNSIDPLGVYTDDVSTTRELVSAKLTGNWAYGHYRFRPSAELLYFHEDQKDYTNRISIYIPGQSVSLGRLTFGPEVGYHFVLASGVVLEPFVGLKGIWDFNKTDDTTLTGMVIGHDPFRGKVEIGAMMWSASGMSLRATASYDGIGDGDFHAYQGQLSIAIPLN